MAYETCSNCNGSGEGMYDGSICRYCKGSGEVEIEDEIDFDEYKREPEINSDR